MLCQQPWIEINSCCLGVLPTWIVGWVSSAVEGSFLPTFSLAIRKPGCVKLYTWNGYHAVCADDAFLSCNPISQLRELPLNVWVAFSPALFLGYSRESFNRIESAFGAVDRKTISIESKAGITLVSTFPVHVRCYHLSSLHASPGVRSRHITGTTLATRDECWSQPRRRILDRFQPSLILISARDFAFSVASCAKEKWIWNMTVDPGIIRLVMVVMVSAEHFTGKKPN